MAPRWVRLNATKLGPSYPGADNPRPVTVVRVQFALLDAFGTPVGTYTQDAEGSYSQNTVIDLHTNGGVRGPLPYFTTIDTYPGARSVLISIFKIRFADTTFTPDFLAEVAHWRRVQGDGQFPGFASAPTPTPGPSQSP